MINVSDVSDEEVVDDGPLQFSDVEPYLQKTVQTDDPNLSEYLDKLRIQAARNRVHRVNINYKKLREVWPQGTPIDFFVALEMFANLTDIELRGELTNPKNIQKIVNEVENRRKGTPSTHQLIKQSQVHQENHSIGLIKKKQKERNHHNLKIPKPWFFCVVHKKRLLVILQNG